METNNQKTWTIWYAGVVIFGALLLQQIWTTSRQTAAIPYSEFEQLVASKKVAEVVIDPDMIEGTLTERIFRPFCTTHRTESSPSRQRLRPDFCAVMRIRLSIARNGACYW